MEASDIPPVPTSFFVRIQDFDVRGPGDEGIGIRLLIYWELARTGNFTCANFETTVEWCDFTVYSYSAYAVHEFIVVNIAAMVNITLRVFRLHR